VVTITGVSFGTTQGSGSVWIGSASGSVTGWSNTQVTASVADNAVSGIVKIQQNGAWSNAVTFTVPASFGSGTQVTIVPNEINMLVGSSQSIQALNSSGQSVTGLTWTSSNPAVATLSTDDPPVITALATGNTTITAGDASADVNVFAGATLATGTVIWSNPGDGSGVSCIIPAVPSSTGVADVFAVQGDGSVQAITSGGTTAWTAPSVNVGCSSLIPDFQGGLVVATGQSIYRLDGMTGNAYPAYTSASGANLATPVVHTNGTIFTVDGSSVVGINPTTGLPNFSVAMQNSTLNGAAQGSPSSIGNLIVAGDGYAYVPYQYSQSTGVATQYVTSSSTNQYLDVLRVGSGGDSYDIPVKQWSTGSSQVTTITDTVPQGYAWCNSICQGGNGSLCNASPQNMYQCAENCLPFTGNGCSSQPGVVYYVCSYPQCSAGTTVSASTSVNGPNVANLITNSDQGVLLSFQTHEGVQFFQTIVTCIPGPSCGIGSGSNTYSSSPGVTNSYLATVSSSGGISLAMLNLPGQQAPVQPVLQRQDGNFIGTVGIGSQPGQVTQTNMIAFTPSGTSLFNVPNDTPKIATADNGVIGASGTTYDQNGNVDGQLAGVPTQSWLGNQYKLGSIELLAGAPTDLATTLWALQGANASGKGTAAVNYEPPQAALQTIAGTNLTAQSACNQFLNNLTQIAISNGRSPGGTGFTKAALLNEIQTTASGAMNYIYDGPSSTTPWEECTPPGCVAMFPVWFTGVQEQPGYQVKQIFTRHSTVPYLEGLSQYNGYAIWLRLISDWSGAWKGLISQYVHKYPPSKFGQVNSYGLGTLLHEVLHKNSVGGGFTHDNMAKALGIAACADDGEGHNSCSVHIADGCFPNN